MGTARSSPAVLADLPRGCCGFKHFEGSVIFPDLRCKNFHLFISRVPIKAKSKAKNKAKKFFRAVEIAAETQTHQLGSAALMQAEQFPLPARVTIPLQSPALREKLISGCFHISAQKPQKFNYFKRSQATHTPGTELLNPLNRT